MTLFKQMALAVSILILTILGAVMMQNYQSAKKDMVEALYQTTVNNISTLSNKLSQNANIPTLMREVINSQVGTTETDKTPAIIKSIIDAEFDSGYYKLIEFKTDHYDYKQIDMSPPEGVPSWFINFANIELKPVVGEVNSGWTQLGTLTVQADANIIYKALYRTFINLLYLFSLFSAISILAINILLHFILRPVKMMKKQAEAILKNEFIIQKEEPYTTDFKEVALAMNSMVTRVEEIFRKATQEAKRNKELLYNDPVTKLYNRRYLMIKLPELLTIESKSNGGTIILVSLDGAEVINQTLGRQEADNIFYEIAKIFTSTLHTFHEGIVARVNGTEFTMVIPNCEKEDALGIIERINKAFNALLQENKLQTTQVKINIGAYKYTTGVDVSDLLTKVDTALLKAKADETNNVYFYQEEFSNEALSKTQWREMLDEAIHTNSFTIQFYDAIDTQTKKIFHKVLTFNLLSKDGDTYSYGEFIAPAINFGMTTKLYLIILDKLFLEHKYRRIEENYVVRLPKEFLEDEDMLEQLSHLFAKYPKTMRHHLFFEVTDSFAIHDTATLKGYVDLFRKYKFGFGINSFTGEANDFEYLKEISPEFLKADVNFLLDQSTTSMAALQLVANSLNVEIIASFVTKQEEVQELTKYQITKIQGPVTDNF
ncbi:diguanylate cyclase [Sulfurimonas sp.]|uniref:bifunctional diguanylate cyclase/phosphodiesterase n=1 Tax=Sulfurimonas sp. TaxID=2022749 RepID=UPI002635C6F9|nr:diguanylate cyclase [Sulfurimonas sp.]